MNGKKILATALFVSLISGIIFPFGTTFAEDNPKENQEQKDDNPPPVIEGDSETSTTDTVFQGVLSGIGGVPLGPNMKYSFTYSGLRAAIVCYSSNQNPEINSSTVYTCMCHVPKGTCKQTGGLYDLLKEQSGEQAARSIGGLISGIATQEVTFSSGGTKSTTFTFATEKKEAVEKDEKKGIKITQGTASATITANVYDGSASLDDKNSDGGFVMPGDPPDNGFPTSTGVLPTTTGGEGGPEFFEGGPPITKDKGNPPDDGGTFPENPNGDGTPLPSDTGNNDPWDSAINSLLGDSDDSFNIADDDWASSGGWGGSDTLDDYLDGAMDGESDGYTVDDLLGLNSGVDDDASLMDLNGDGTADGVDLDSDGNPDGTLLDTDGDGVYDAIDLDGDGKPDGRLIDEDGDGVMDGIDYNGDGVIDKYFGGHEPSSNNESGGANYLNRAEEDDGLWDMLMRQLSSNNGTDTMQADSSSAKTNSRLINSLFGDDAQNIQNNTLSDQELFDMARAQLEKMGFSDKDILNGKQYSKNSAWTEPSLAWDFNRITTLVKKKKIDISKSARNHAQPNK